MCSQPTPLLQVGLTVICIFTHRYLVHHDHTANEDYSPISQAFLEFALVTNYTQCINITIIDDTILEVDEEFFLESGKSDSTTSVPSVVSITIQNDDSE